MRLKTAIKNRVCEVFECWHNEQDKKKKKQYKKLQEFLMEK